MYIRRDYLTERCAIEWKGRQVLPGASRRGHNPLSQVTCVDACGAWRLPATDSIPLKCMAALLLRGSTVLRAGVLEPSQNIYLTDLVCVCLCLLLMQSGRLLELTL